MWRFIFNSQLTGCILLPQLADDPNVVIAKMDATANDVPSPYEVSGWVDWSLAVIFIIFVWLPWATGL